jgi:hypothetical protein
LGLAAFPSLFNGCSGCPLVVLAALRATASIRQPFNYGMFIELSKATALFPDEKYNNGNSMKIKETVAS